jgi:hypothetical protein
VVIADEAGFGSDPDMTVSSVAVNENRADRRGIRIVDWQTFEPMTAHQDGNALHANVLLQGTCDRNAFLPNQP